MQYLLIASILWGTSFIAGKYAEPYFSPELLVLLRMLIASLFITHIAIPYIKRLDKTLLYKVIFVSFLTFPVTFMLQFIGLKYTTASNAVTMIGFEPLIVLIVGHLFFEQKASYKQFSLALLAFFGVLLVMGKPDLSNQNFVGCVIVLSSGMAVAIWLQLSKVLMNQLPTGSYTPLTIFFGSLLTIPSSFLLKIMMGTDWELSSSLSSPVALSSLLYLGIGCSLIAGWAWNKGVEITNANMSGLFLALEPVFGVIFAILLLGDRPKFWGAVGIALVLFSVLYSFRMSKD